MNLQKAVKTITNKTDMPWVSGPDQNRKTAAVKTVWSIKEKE